VYGVCQSAASNLTSILLILTSIAKGIPRSRAILKEAIFPNNAIAEPAENPIEYVEYLHAALTD
jgi:hypothetical protein